MSSTTDANGRQRTPTDAAHQLRKTVARAIHECGPEGNKDGDDWEFGYIGQYVTAVYEQSDAAIAAMVTALLSDEAYETDPDGRNIYYSPRGTVRAALRRIGAVEGETK